MASIQSLSSVVRRSLRIPMDGFESRVSASRLTTNEKAQLVRSSEAIEGLVGPGAAAYVAKFNSVLVGLRPGGLSSNGEPRDQLRIRGLARRMRDASGRRAFIQQQMQLNTERIAALGQELDALRGVAGVDQATGRLALEA